MTWLFYLMTYDHLDLQVLRSQSTGNYIYKCQRHCPYQSLALLVVRLDVLFVNLLKPVQLKTFLL